MLKVVLDANGQAVGAVYVPREVLTIILSSSLPIAREPQLLGCYAVLAPEDLLFCTTDEHLPTLIYPPEEPEEKSNEKIH